MNCSIHPEMRGYLLLRTSPYMAKTNAKGEFTIRQLPTSKVQLRFWHERIGYLRNVSFGQLKSDKRGTVSVLIRPGSNKLGTATLTPKQFNDDTKTKKIP